MARDYLGINREVLEGIKVREGENSARYRTLLRYLQCQNIYAQELEKGKKKEEAWEAAAAHWNAWSQPLLEEREWLEKNGQWEAGQRFSGSSDPLIGRNEATRKWLERAEAEFSDLALGKKRVRPSDAITGKASDDGKIARAIVSVILEDISFAFFHFPSDVRFGNVQFHANALFGKAQFHAGASFWKAQFRALTSFGGARFHAATLFGEAQFRADTVFRDVQFYGDVSFRLAEFEHPLTFVDAGFRQGADFSSIRSRRGFLINGARFGKVPDFNEAEFHVAPVLDDISVADQLDGWRWKIFRSVKEPEENAKAVSRNFRALGRMAHEGRDWLNEMEFFAQETRTRRFGLDTPFGRNPGRFWFGLFYEKFSNFGRSMWRPFAHWLVLTFAIFPLLYLVLAAGGDSGHMLGWLGFMVASMTLIYFWASRERRSFMRQIMRRMLKVLRKPAVRVLHHFIRPVSALACLAIVTTLYLKFFVPAGFPGVFSARWADAWMLSLRQGMVVSGVTRNGHLMTTLKSLYGTVNGGGVELSHAVAAWMIGQTVLSAICFFFLFLALRNHFRIR